MGMKLTSTVIPIIVKVGSTFGKEDEITRCDWCYRKAKEKGEVSPHRDCRLHCRRLITESGLLLRSM